MLHFGAMKPRKLAQLALCLGLSGQFEGQVTHVQVDSKKAGPGTLFFAHKGKRFDGHDFLEEASSKGAIGAVVSKTYSGPNFGLQLLRVENVIRSLQEIAKVVLDQTHPYIIGITGSLGKTTTKEFTTTLLRERFRVNCSEGNQNSQIGLPMTILNRDEEEDILILEMAMSEQGQLKRLINIAPPDLAVVTRVSASHFDNFGDLGGIARAKGEIFSSPRTRLGILSTQAAQFLEIISQGKSGKTTCGEGGDYQLRENRIFDNTEHSPEIALPFEATHLRDNFLLAACIARNLGLSWDEIAKGAEKLKPYKHRFETRWHEGICFIDDSYNANPESTKAALANIPKPKTTGKTIVVFGEMVGLGKECQEGHLEVAEYAASHVDQALLFGSKCQVMLPVFEKKQTAAELCSSLLELKTKLHEMASSGDVVLIKGSNPNELWRLFDEEL